MKNYLWIIAIGILNACDLNNQAVEPSAVLIHRYGFLKANEVIDTDTSYLKLIEDSASTITLYQGQPFSDSSVFEAIIKYKSEDSILQYRNQSCRLVDSKTYSINDGNYRVDSYYYDVESSSDEECTIYFCEAFGLLIVYNDGWLMMGEIFEYNDESNTLIKAVLSDTTNEFSMIDRKAIIKATFPDND